MGTSTLDDEVRSILTATRTIAVVGLSDNPLRPSFGVAEYLREVGYQIVPVNPKLTTWEGIRAFPDLESVAAAGIKVDLVDVFRDPTLVEPIVDEAVRIGATTIWFQEGVVNQTAAQKARAAGLRVVMDRCAMKDHARLIG